MRILFDQGTPVPLRGFLRGHHVSTAYEQHWDELQNGDLLQMAEAAGFEAIITTDQNLRYQQNLAERRLAILVLLTTNWPLIRSHLPLVVDAVDRLKPTAYTELSFPRKVT